MITIFEKRSNKLPCLTSLYFKLPFYNQNLFDKLIQVHDCVYDYKTTEFEYLINKLYFLIDILTKFDDVEYRPFIQDKKLLNTCDEMKFKIKPYSYQKDGINYGLNNNNWLLLDDQGLGKTVQMIYLAESLKKKNKISHCLIVCGINSLKYNWANEIKDFSKLSYTILGQTTTKTGKVKITSIADRCKILKNGIKEFFIITNIETLQSNEFVEAFNKGKTNIDMIVLDEAHKCNNPSAKSVKNLLKLKANYTIALTGTIITNVPENAYVALKWTNNIKSTYSKFKSTYNVYGGFGGIQVIGYKNLDILQDLLASCSLRRLKSEVLDLPEKTYLIEYVDMKPQQQALYDTVSKGISAELDLLPNKPTILQELTINARLRQITAYPGMLSSEVTQSAKLDRLEELVETIVAQGDKVVVFNSFKGAAEEAAKRLSIYNPLVCTGDQDDYQINENKKLFANNKDYKILVCTWQKMGAGHTLTAANYCIFVDTPWTDADFQQSADRIFRIGQNKHVFIITLITKNTYDERVQEILEKKECLSGYLIDNKDCKNINIFNENAEN